MNTTALIAEDEPLLAAGLKAELLRLWPELTIVASVGHGRAAVDQALRQQPQILFLDVRMPGMNGLEAAQEIAEEWAEGQPLPLLVFVTAYDEYARQAFDHAAIDYVLKPVQPARLEQTCARLKQALLQRLQSPPTAGHTGLDATLEALRGLLAASGTGTLATPPARISMIQAGVGAAIHMVPVDEVLYFEAADKYVRLVTAEREHLIRTSLRELIPQLDSQRFWQIHRGTVVRADAIAVATRDDNGKFSVTLRGHGDRLQVSRLYAHLFKAM